MFKLVSVSQIFNILTFLSSCSINFWESFCHPVFVTLPIPLCNLLVFQYMFWYYVVACWNVSVVYIYITHAGAHTCVWILFYMTWRGKGSFPNDCLWYLLITSLGLEERRQVGIRWREEEKNKKGNLWTYSTCVKKTFMNA